MLPVRALPSVALILKANRSVMQIAIAGSSFWRYGGHMGQHRQTELGHLAGLLLAAASLSACDGAAKTKDIVYDTEDRGIIMPEPKKAAREKCYGIALAQFNDCAAGPKTECAGTAVKDYMPDRWKYVPAGSCETEYAGALQPGDPLPESNG
jgi:uncharacterized membrane protein